MTIMLELAIVFGVCLVSEGISVLLPFRFPAGVISMILLLGCLLTGVVKKEQISRVSQFFIVNMAFFFVAPCVGIIDHVPTLVSFLLPFLFISVVTTPLVYCAAGWTTQLLIRLVDRKEEDHG